MSKNFKSVSIIAVCAILGALGAWFVIDRAFTVEESSAAPSARSQRLVKSARSGSVKKITEISVDSKSGKKSVRIVESEEERPNVIENLDADDEANLTDAQKSVLREIQDALDADDIKKLRKALSKFTASVSAGGLGGYASVPRVIRSAAVQALGWFGKDAVVDLLDFMADADEEVSSDAFDQFELALDDVSLSARERAELVKSLSKVLTDEERIDTMLFSLNEMPNSVKAETVLAILEEGSAQSQKLMLEQLDFYLDEGIETVDDVKKWIAENPDDPDDEEFYAGEKE